MTDAPFSIEKLELPGVLRIRPKMWPDARGYSAVSYDARAFSELGVPTRVAYEYVSSSRKNVLRGLHFQEGAYAQDKLVRCSFGEIFDVAADVDPQSPTYGRSVSAHLKAEEQMMLFIPGKYAHGFCVLSENAVAEYKLSAPRSAEHERGARWNDPSLAIAWPVAKPVVSDKDKAWPLLPSVSVRSEVPR